MTYTTGSTILATDYNGFVSTTAGANLNDIWSTGSGDKGWGQTAVATVSAGGSVTATQWASLVNNLATAGSQTGVTETARTAPTAGNTISILAALNTDLTSVTTNRGFATVAGTEYGTFTGTTSKTAATSNGAQGAWQIQFTHTVTFPSADQARYFWNAGGLVRLQYGKSSTGTDIDPDWNTFAGQPGSLYITGIAGAKTIVGVSYTGTTRIGGTGGTQAILSTGTGWYALTGTLSNLFQLTNAAAPYTGEYILTQASATATALTLVTTWFQPAVSAAGTTTNISGGTGVSSPATSIGAATAPTTLVTYIPPSTTYLTNSWGTPTIAASVA